MTRPRRMVNPPTYREATSLNNSQQILTFPSLPRLRSNSLDTGIAREFTRHNVPDALRHMREEIRGMRPGRTPRAAERFNGRRHGRRRQGTTFRIVTQARRQSWYNFLPEVEVFTGQLSEQCCHQQIQIKLSKQALAAIGGILILLFCFLTYKL